MVSPPWAVRMVLWWLKERVQGSGRLQIVCPVLPDRGDLFRSDARAEKDGLVVIGGWDCSEGRPSTAARWYSVRVEPSWAPWVFAKSGDPGRVIAARELLSIILLSIMLLGDGWPACAGAGANTSLGGSTDNQGNTYAVAKLLSSKWPLTVLVVELSELLRKKGSEIRLSWLPRLQNQEADDLTNEKFSSFDPKLRVEVVPSELKWLVLPQLMEASHSLYKDIVKERENRVGPIKPFPWKKIKSNARISMVQPW